MNKDTLWDDQLGYGWVKPAISDEDARWIAEPLERGACRIDPGHVFRLRLAPGKHHLRISAEPFGPTGVITVKAAVGEQRFDHQEQHIGELDVQGGPTPIEIDQRILFHQVDRGDRQRPGCHPTTRKGCRGTVANPKGFVT